MGPQKALETIGANLQKQYENWQPRVSLLCLFSFLMQGLRLLGLTVCEPGRSSRRCPRSPALGPSLRVPARQGRRELLVLFIC